MRSISANLSAMLSIASMPSMGMALDMAAAALHHLRHEVPHALAVVVDEFKRRSQDMTYVGATLFVERDSQKGIVIGQGGRTLKTIGRSARAEIEKLVDTRVFLELWVKVRPKWRKKENELRRLGYTMPKK